MGDRGQAPGFRAVANASLRPGTGLIDQREVIDADGPLNGVVGLASGRRAGREIEVSHVSGRQLTLDAFVTELVEDGTLSGLEAAIKKYGTLADQEDDETDEEAALGAAANTNDPAEQQRKRIAANDAAPRSLYIQRKVKNAAAIIAWAKSQGFETTLAADDLHVTIAYSRTPVDWMKVGESWASELKVGAGGPRLMEQFGEATVLLFTANELRWRHEGVKEAGGSWDHPEYQPHITISYGFTGDLSKVQPYQGEIVLGPELFSEVNEDWRGTIDDA